MRAIETGDEAPEFELQERRGELVRLADFRGRRNVLLVFHPWAFTPVCEEEALDLEANLPAFENANTEVVFVSCDPPPARQAWKAQLGATYVFASDFWPHGRAARDYGVFDETRGVPLRGTFLIDLEGIVVWSLVRPTSERRTELASAPLDAAR